MAGTSAQGFWGTLSGYYKDAKSWLSSSSAGQAWSELSSGWKYGDLEYDATGPKPLSAAGAPSFLYTVGDYAEGAYRNAKGAFNTWQEGQKALQALGIGGEDAQRAMPKIGMVSSRAGQGYSTGQFTAGQASASSIGQSDYRIRRMAEIARNSQLPAIRMTVERTALTTRGGRRTIGIPSNPTVNVRSSTQVS